MERSVTYRPVSPLLHLFFTSLGLLFQLAFLRCLRGRLHHTMIPISLRTILLGVARPAKLLVVIRIMCFSCRNPLFYPQTHILATKWCVPMFGKTFSHRSHYRRHGLRLPAYFEVVGSSVFGATYLEACFVVKVTLELDLLCVVYALPTLHALVCSTKHLSRFYARGILLLAPQGT